MSVFLGIGCLLSSHVGLTSFENLLVHVLTTDALFEEVSKSTYAEAGITL